MGTPSYDIRHVPGDVGPTFKISRHMRFRDANRPTLWEVLSWWWRSGRKL